MDFLEIPYADRHHVDDLSDLYAVIVALERIEKAFHRDLITNENYDTILRKLIHKYKTMVSQLESDATRQFQADAFWSEYGSKCSAARQRLRLGHPADVKQQEQQAAAALATSQQQQQDKAERDKRFDPKLVLECGQYFITMMDCLKLQQTAVDQLFPILSDLVTALRKFPHARDVLPVLGKLEGWAQRLTTMHPSDELSERDTRELAFDLERGYQTFYQFLSTNSAS